MSAAIETGLLEHVATVAKRVTGRKPAPATIWRWCKKGLRGGSIRLHCKYHAGCWCTTEAAFREFIDTQTEAALAGETDDASDEALAAAGLL